MITPGKVIGNAYDPFAVIAESGIADPFYVSPEKYYFLGGA